MKTGTIFGEDIDAYHEQDAVSHSKLKALDDCPLLYFRKYVARTIPDDFERKAAQSVGTAIHALLEGGQTSFNHQVAVNRKFKDFKTAEARDWRDTQLLTGKVVLTKAELGTVLSMHASILAHPDASQLLLEGQPEVTFRLALEKFHVQARADRWHPKGIKLPSLPDRPLRPTIVDLKSTASLAADGFETFQKAFRDRKYYRQAALYREVVASVEGLTELPDFFYVVTENCEPFNTVVFEPDRESMALARKEILGQLRTLRDCYTTGIWPGQPSGVVSLGLDQWYVRKTALAIPAERPALTDSANADAL